MAEAKTKLFFGNLDYSITEDDLKAFLSQTWNLVEVKLLEGKGVAFVTFSSAEEAESAKEKLSGLELKGRNMKVDFAHDKPRNNDRRGGGGGFRGGPRGGNDRERGGRKPSYR
ncbi:MAG: RNA-binding protein [Candidatus Caenarcaniphilales bacterium]|nr:RNA-binding protein [Candidatus Caenarcaniphilales bacterium]